MILFIQQVIQYLVYKNKNISRWKRIVNVIIQSKRLGKIINIDSETERLFGSDGRATVWLEN